MGPCSINTTVWIAGSNRALPKNFPFREINGGGRISPVLSHSYFIKKYVGYFAIICQRPRKKISYTTLEADNNMNSQRLTSPISPSYSFPLGFHLRPRFVTARSTSPSVNSTRFQSRAPSTTKFFVGMRQSVSAIMLEIERVEIVGKRLRGLGLWERD